LYVWRKNKEQAKKRQQKAKIHKEKEGREEKYNRLALFAGRTNRREA